MPLEVIDAVIAEAGAGRVGVRISPGHIFNDIEEADTAELYDRYIRELDKRGLAYLHVQRPTSNTLDIDVVEMPGRCFAGR